MSSATSNSLWRGLAPLAPSSVAYTERPTNLVQISRSFCPVPASPFPPAGNLVPSVRAKIYGEYAYISGSLGYHKLRLRYSWLADIVAQARPEGCGAKGVWPIYGGDRLIWTKLVDYGIVFSEVDMPKETPFLGDFNGRDYSTDISEHTDPYGAGGFPDVRMSDEKSIARDLDDDPYQLGVAPPQILGGVSWQSILEHEAWEAGLREMAEELNGEARQRELVAKDLCDYIVRQWRAGGSHNVPVEISGRYPVEALLRARELFLRLPANLNMGDSKADLYMTMGRRNGNPYIILCVPGAVV
jgi:hypothetical protein